jgi:hypothetical protein
MLRQPEPCGWGTKAELPDRQNDHKLIAVGRSRCFQVAQPAPRAKPPIPALCPRQHDWIGALLASSSHFSQ